MEYTKEQMIEFTNSVGFNHEYKGEGKWQKKEFDDEPLVDVREYTTDELLTIFLKENTIDWNDFAEALKERFGESLIEEEKGEEDPMNWWLTDVTVEDIVEFVKNYR